MDQAQQIAALLLDIKAITFNVQQPYTYTSGIRSPIYCDNRLILSYPKQRAQIIDAFLSLIKTKQLQFDCVAGTATAGIAHAAWIADRLNKPMVYVRSQTKGHGKQNQIEGVIKTQQLALIVEDLITTGSSSIAAGLALREKNATVIDCLAIFTYQMPTAEKNFTQANIRLHSLSNFITLIEVAQQQDMLTEEEKNVVLEWHKDPANWRK